MPSMYNVHLCEYVCREYTVCFDLQELRDFQQLAIGSKHSCVTLSRDRYSLVFSYRCVV